jgi:hypothetical protein
MRYKSPSQDDIMRIPEFSADAALMPRSVLYSGAPHQIAPESSAVVPQLRIGGGGFGAADSCDGCATFSYVGCLMDCEQAGSGPGSDCTAKCLARRFECDVCNGPFFHFGGAVMM